MAKDSYGLQDLASNLLPFVLSPFVALAGGVPALVDTIRSRVNRDHMRNYLKEEYGFDDDTVEALIDQYGDDVFNLFDSNTWGNGEDLEGLDKAIKEYVKARDELGYAPDYLMQSDIDALKEEANAELDKEYNSIMDLYKQSYGDQIADNANMFADYRNQILTNEAMRQNAIAGATRFELDRQQRNAITRGASAAQRLVASVNSQLGMQAQSAQQALDTSNALAQNLLAHRQAQQNVRSAYTNAQADLLRGQTAERFNYGQSKINAAQNERDIAREGWDAKVSSYFNENSALESYYRKRYGSGQRPSNAI